MKLDNKKDVFRGAFTVFKLVMKPLVPAVPVNVPVPLVVVKSPVLAGHPPTKHCQMSDVAPTVAFPEPEVIPNVPTIGAEKAMGASSNPADMSILDEARTPCLPNAKRIFPTLDFTAIPPKKVVQLCFDFQLFQHG
jgi:hypothetical protein